MDDLFQQIKQLEGSEQIVVANISKNGVDVAKTVLDIDTIKRFGAIDEFSVPEGCTLSLRAFDDPIDAEKYVRGLK